MHTETRERREYRVHTGCGCGTWLSILGVCGLLPLRVWAGVLPIVNKRLRAASEEAPPFETVVHGTVRLKRARPTFHRRSRQGRECGEPPQLASQIALHFTTAPELARLSAG